MQNKLFIPALVMLINAVLYAAGACIAIGHLIGSSDHYLVFMAIPTAVLLLEAWAYWRTRGKEHHRRYQQIHIWGTAASIFFLYTVLIALLFPMFEARYLSSFSDVYFYAGVYFIVVAIPVSQLTFILDMMTVWFPEKRLK